MTIKQELQVWKDRWQSLDFAIEQSLLRLHSSPEVTERRETICYLLKCLQIFGKSHFDYFHQGFIKGRFKLEDKNRKKYPPAMILRAITDQIAYDIEVITKAFDQRRPYGNNKIKKALEDADKLGQMAMRPAIDSGLVPPNVTVLTYFQKAITVRIIPYANVAIIGIPFSTIQFSRDYLAVPHEVAHYIFRHGKLNGRSISSTINEKIARSTPELYLRQWIEEIFADTYGCIVAGPVMAIDFQDLQLDDPWEEFLDATIDIEDPVPVLRPEIYSKVLYMTKNNDWKSVIELVSDRWKQKRDKYLAKDQDNEDLDFRIGNNRRIKLDDIRLRGKEVSANKKFDKLLSRILARVFNRIINIVKPGKRKRGYFHWSGNKKKLSNILKTGDIDSLYEVFEKSYSTIHRVYSFEEQGKYIKSNPDKPVVWIPDFPCDSASFIEDSELAEAGFSTSRLWSDYVSEWAKSKGFNEITKENKVKELLGTERQPQSDDDTMDEFWGWVELAIADGWVTRGPEPNPDPT